MLSTILVFVAFLLLFGMFIWHIVSERCCNVGTVVKNMHHGIYVVNVNGRKLPAQSVDWDIKVGSKVTMKVYYGVLYITGVFIKDPKSAEIISETNC